MTWNDVLLALTGAALVLSFFGIVGWLAYVCRDLCKNEQDNRRAEDVAYACADAWVTEEVSDGCAVEEEEVGHAEYVRDTGQSKGQWKALETKADKGCETEAHKGLAKTVKVYGSIDGTKMSFSETMVNQCLL
jgi:hypothetical protein